MEEAKERRERMAKMRSLLFAHEQKAKRLKAIKSKGFHRHAKKASKMKVRELNNCTVLKSGLLLLCLTTLFLYYQLMVNSQTDKRSSIPFGCSALLYLNRVFNAYTDTPIYQIPTCPLS